MITTNSEEDFKCLMQLRWMGITKDTWGRLEKVTMPNENSQKGYGWYYEVQELGYKYHMNDLAFALGLVQLSKLEANNNRRRELAKIYTEKFSDISEIECPEVIPDVITAQHNYVIRCDKRDELHLFLREHNISSGVHYMPIHLQPFYRRLFPDVSLPMTEKQWIRLLTLPLFPDMSQNEQAYIIDCVRKFAK